MNGRVPPNSIHHVVGPGGWENGTEGFHLSKIAVMESRMWKNVMATKKNCDLWEESSGHLQVRTSGIWDVGTDIIIKVMSEAELCACITYITLQTFLKHDAVHLTLTSFDWFLSFSLLSLFLPWISLGAEKLCHEVSLVAKALPLQGEVTVFLPTCDGWVSWPNSRVQHYEILSSYTSPKVTSSNSALI